ncbi:N-substituted formamide deformylase precursor [Corynebacterium ciconiae DSM 44920]|uniref:amidohydrolase n=1 Tax=Corynebacterium ciconiae TaxID=227319 RepID=UPI000360EEDB|nr:amidohydrolase [Corynebacterium ciconiae]WKD62210.1 N-substituted formamide deformylase precursor [Corynebacterium ciconiae DSM 44920]
MSHSPIVLVENATILTQDPARPVATAVAMMQGRFVAVDDAARRLPADRRIDAGGATIVPGFNDAHAHTVWFGQTLSEVDLSAVHTTSDVYEKVAAAAASLGAEEWVIASGFRPSALKDGELGIAELDRAAGGRPLLIKHNSGHANTVNTAALRAAGVDPQNPPQVEGGEVVCDSTGQATGLLDENAMRLIQQVLLPESNAEIAAAIETATAHYLQEGLTSVTDCGVAGGWIGHSPREIGAYQQATRHTRMQIMPTIDALHEIGGHESDGFGYGLDGGIRTGLGDEWLQIGPTKMFTDGSILGTTAAMTQDYVCCPHHGYFQGDPEHMRRQALGAAAAGWSLALHALGDAAVDLSISILSEAIDTFGAPEIPHRIEHGGVVRNDQLDTIGGRPIVIVPQPRFVHAFGDSMASVLGTERAAFSYPARRLLDAGLILPGSSDRPVAEGAPLKAIESFVLRTTQSGQVYGENERLSAEQALYAYTAGSAAATGWAGLKGQIMPGQLADCVLLDRNPLEVASEEIGQLQVQATILGGDVVYGEI